MIKKQIFGLDISDYSIEVLVLTKPFFGKPKIESYARTILRGDVISNGIIKKPDKLAESLTALLKSAQPKPIKSRYCVISLPESQVFSTVFKLPAGLKYNEIKNTIPFKAEEVIPFKSSEVYFDFKRIGVIGQSQEIFYVAIPIKIVDAYVEVFEKAGLIPVAFDLESNSLARSLIDVSKKSDGAKLLLDIGARTTNLNIFDNNGIRQSLTIKIAGDRFTKAIASKLNIKPKDASDLKMKNGFDAEKQDGKVLLVLQNEFKRIIAETKKFVEYYKSDYGRGVSEVILVGGSSFLPKVDQYLADNLEIETNIGKPFGKIADPRELVNLKGKSVLFANVAGLALRGLDKNPIHCDINLLPVVPVQFSLAPAKEDRRAWLEVYIRLGVLIILILVLAGIISLRRSGYDIYDKFIVAPDYETDIKSEVDFDVLEETRQLLLVSTTTATSSGETATTTEEITEEVIEDISEVLFKIVIRNNSLGYLNVRSGPATSFNKIAEVDPGEEHEVIAEEGDWFQIQLDEETIGWVSSAYVDKIE